MRFSSGFIKMDRKLISEFEGDITQLGLITFLIASSNWSNKPSLYTKMGITHEVQYGQYITTYAVLQEFTGCSFRNLKARLDRLNQHGYITLKSLKNCMLIALCVDKCQSTSSAEGMTNEEYKNIRINNYTSKEVSSDSPNFPSDISWDEKTKGNKISSNNPQKRKNIPPVTEMGSDNRFTPEDLLELWNGLSGPLPKIKKMTKDRTAKCKVRLRENCKKEFWETVIKNLASSNFAIEGKWATFDWIVKNETNALKAFEGNYQNKKSRLSSYDPPKIIPY